MQGGLERDGRFGMDSCQQLWPTRKLPIWFIWQVNDSLHIWLLSTQQDRQKQCLCIHGSHEIHVWTAPGAKLVWCRWQGQSPKTNFQGHSTTLASPSGTHTWILWCCFSFTEKTGQSVFQCCLDQVQRSGSCVRRKPVHAVSEGGPCGQSGCAASVVTVFTVFMFLGTFASWQMSSCFGDLAGMFQHMAMQGKNAHVPGKAGKAVDEEVSMISMFLNLFTLLSGKHSPQYLNIRYMFSFG